MGMVDNIECVSSSDGMEDDNAVSSNLPRPFLKTSVAAVAAASIGGASRAGAGGGTPGPLTPPATSVHELLECPVCTNSMYPPIHQFYSAKMVIPFDQPGKLGCTTATLPVDRS